MRKEKEDVSQSRRRKYEKELFYNY